MRLFFPLFSFDAAFGALFSFVCFLLIFSRSFTGRPLFNDQKLGTLANAMFFCYFRRVSASEYVCGTAAVSVSRTGYTVGYRTAYGYALLSPTRYSYFDKTRFET